jgi:Condensation domain
VLASALDVLSARHESLRAAFPEHDGLPFKIVVPRAPIELEQSTVALDGFRAAVCELFQGLAAEPFDLAAPPLVRVHLASASDTQHALFVNFHHAIVDGWSIGVFNRELSEAYAAALAGRPPDLPELDVQYVDYAEWQREWVDSAECEEHLAYWRELFREPPPPLEFATAGGIRSRSVLERGGQFVFDLAPRLVSGLRARAAAAGVTLFAVLFTALQLLLTRSTRERRIVIGIAAANRVTEETERLIGLFINSVAIPATIDLSSPLDRHLTATRDAVVDAVARASVPFDRVVAEVHPDRDPSLNPVFQVLFGLEPTSLTLRLPGVVSTPIRLGNGYSKFDLSLLVEEGENGGATVEIEYRRDLFSEEFVRLLAQHYDAVLASVANAPPATPLGRLSLMAEGERERVLAFSHGT